MMTFAQFVSWAISQVSLAKYNDGTNLGECVSLINQYCYRVLGIPAGAWGNAYAWGLPSNANVMQYFNLVPDAQKQAGDILVYPAGWSGSAPGHITIYLGNNQMLEQNGRISRKIDQGAIESGYYAILRSKGGNDVATKQDIGTAQKIAFWAGRRDPSDPNNLADLNANHVGQDMETDIDNWWKSGENQQTMAMITTAIANAALVPGLQKQVADLTAQLTATPPPTPGGFTQADRDTLNWIQKAIAAIFRINI